MSRLPPIRSSSLREQAVAAIRMAIFGRALGPGDPLRELHLARDSRVGQPTVRGALLELEREGLVVRTPEIGTAVTNMSALEVKEALRERLEAMAMTEASSG